MPTISTHVTDDLSEIIKRNALKYHRGKVSAYLAEILEREILNKNIPPPMTEEERQLLKDLADEVKTLKAKVSQMDKTTKTKK